MKTSQIIANVVKILNAKTIVINKGEHDGINKDNKFILYYLGDEIIDTRTGERLGTLEVVCGQARVKHLQERLSTLESDNYETSQVEYEIKQPQDDTFTSFMRRTMVQKQTVSETRTEKIVLPFDFNRNKNIEIEYFCKLIS